MVTPALIRVQMRLARRCGARVASAAFVRVGLEPVQEGNWWLQQARRLHCPLQVVRAVAAPPRSNKEMEGVAWVADQLNMIPGRLGLHQEFGTPAGPAVAGERRVVWLTASASRKPANCTITTQGPEGRLVKPEPSSPSRAQPPPRPAEIRA
jgi:hypothetical protein